MKGGSLLRVVFFLTLLGLVAGWITPMLLSDLSDVEARKAQQRAERIIFEAAQWYVINNGAPTKRMDTEEVKKALIPFYLNSWPGKKTIECSIDTNGKITVITSGSSNRGFWFAHLFQQE